MTEPVAETYVTRIAMLPRASGELGHLNDGFAKEFLEGIPAASRQDHVLGRKEHPYSFSMANEFKFVNVHHSACIEAKVAATVGLGFQSELAAGVDPMTGTPKPDPATGKPKRKKSKVSAALDALCPKELSFVSLLTKVAMDYWNTGNGWIEVVRREGSEEVLSLYHIPSAEVYVVLEDQLGNVHYEHQPSGGSGFTRVFAKFGDRQRLLASQGRVLGNGSTRIPDLDANAKRGRPRKGTVQVKLSELVHVPRPSSYCRHYGYADWLAAVLSIELVHCKHRHLYDFFLNRGVPEMILSVTGDLIDEPTWTNIKTQLKNTIGPGNQHKTLALNIPNQNAKVEVHKLAMERMTDGLFSELADVLAMQVVSAHGVPPLLAGIQIPGKLGAVNELANAMKAFQALRIAPAQEVFETVLWRTIGQVIPGLQEEDWELRTILEEIDVDKVDTVARMRQPVGEAQAQGRDLDAGVKP